MSDVLKVIELLAESDKSWEDAAQKAVDRACKTLEGVQSIYIKTSRRPSRTVNSSSIALMPKSCFGWKTEHA